MPEESEADSEVEPSSDGTEQNGTKRNVFADGFSRPGNALSDKQLSAIELLASGASLKAVEAALDVARTTVFRWRRREDFRDALRKRQKELWSDAAERLRAMVHPSLEALEYLFASNYDRNRVEAALFVLRELKLGKIAAAED